MGLVRGNWEESRKAWYAGRGWAGREVKTDGQKVGVEEMSQDLLGWSELGGLSEHTKKQYSEHWKTSFCPFLFRRQWEWLQCHTLNCLLFGVEQKRQGCNLLR